MTKHYFVTGSTGAIGSALVPLLLEEKDNRIWILIRANSEAHLNLRMRELYSFWEMDENVKQDAMKRIIPIAGDTDVVNFGLSKQVYESIVKKCTHIIHCAGVVRMNLPLESARQHALGASKNIIEMAYKCQHHGQLKKIEYVSTVGVGGNRPIVEEYWLSAARDYHNSYEQSKAEAEEYIRQTIECADLPITIHRPSMIVGHSKTGKIIRFQIFYYLCEFLSGRQTFGLLPIFKDAQLDTVPVDFVASAIKWSSEQNNISSGKVFHLCSGPSQSILLSDLQILASNQLNKNNSQIKKILNIPISAFEFFLKLLLMTSSQTQRKRLGAIPIYLSYLQDKQRFENLQTIKFFSENGGPTLAHPSSYLANILSTYTSVAYK